MAGQREDGVPIANGAASLHLSVDALQKRLKLVAELRDEADAQTWRLLIRSSL